MDLTELKNILFKRAKEKGFSECEIYCSDNKSFNVSVYKGNIEKYQNSQSGGFCFRGIYNGKMGYYFSENIENPDIESVINNAVSNSEILAGEDEEFIFEGSKEYADVNIYSSEIAELSDEYKINAALEMEKTAAEYDSRITVNRSMVASGESTVYISNTKGLDLSEKSNYLMAYVEAMAVDGNETKEKGELAISCSLKDFKPNAVAEKAAEKAVSSLGGKPVKSGSKKIIIQNETFADILEHFCGNFYADNVQKGFSLLKNKIGEKIAAECISIVDNPLLEGGYSTTAFDSEGVAAYSKNVIENGVLKTYLYNLKSAAKDNTKSTGNGFKGGFKGSVNTAVTNFYIEKGSVSLNEMAESLGEGIIVTDAAGLHSGINSISGDFSLAAEGFKIENGKITTPVNQITIAGNFYDVLKNIEMIGNDIKFNSSAIGSPSLMINNINIAGL